MEDDVARLQAELDKLPEQAGLATQGSQAQPSEEVKALKKELADLNAEVCVFSRDCYEIMVSRGIIAGAAGRICTCVLGLPRVTTVQRECYPTPQSQCLIAQGMDPLLGMTWADAKGLPSRQRSTVR